VFIREAFGPLPAFLFGWAELLIIRPGAYGAISITSAAYTLRLLGLDPAAPVAGLPVRAEQLLAAGYIVAVAAVNYFGIHRGAVLQNLSTAFKVGALVALILLGAGSVVALYLAANLVYLHLIPIAAMRGAELVAADAARLLIGPAGAVAVSAAVAVSTFGTLNGSMMTAPRIFFAMAEDGLFPRAIARVHRRSGAPANAVVLAAALGTVFVLVRTFTQLAEQFVIGIWPFYALAVAAVFVLRRRPGLGRPYTAPGYPWVPALFLAGSLLLLGNYLVSQPLLFLLDVAVILAGVPVYGAWTRRRAGARAATRP